MLYKCTKCPEEKPADQFPTRYRYGKLERLSWCKTCMSRIRKAYKARIGPATPDQLKHRREMNAKHRESRKDPARYIYEDSRKSDRKRSLENNLTRHFIATLIANPCAYCDDTDTWMTLDRINNDIGHTMSNVVPACLRCNYTRGTMPYEAWLIIAPAMKAARLAGLFGDWRTQPIARRKEGDAHSILKK